MFASLLTSFLLASSPFDVILENGLDTPEGRTFFLTERLSPYANHAEALNQEIIALSKQVTEKITELNEMLPTLNLALNVNNDFLQIDDILDTEELSDEQEAVIERLSQICKKVDAFFESDEQP
jgi:hypothetical protein